MIKIKTTKHNRKNLTVNLMTDVTVRFDNDGVALLEDETKLEALLKRDSSLSVIEGKKEPAAKVVAPEPTKSVEKPKAPVDKIPVDDVQPSPSVEEVPEPVEVATVTAEEEVGASLEATEEDEEGFDLETLNFEELKTFCKDSELPKEEWDKFKSKKEFREYIVEKAKEE